MRKTFAIYGKGGIGKSTIASNLAAIYGGEGIRTLLVGCDPKSDSVINIIKRRARPLLEILRTNKRPNPSSFIMSGFNGVKCVEVGGPEPGIGCAGRGLIIGIKFLVDTRIIDDFDLVIFDIPADIFCGGLAVVVKKGYAESAIIVSSDDFMSLYAANNLCRGFNSLNVRVSGIVYNRASQDGQIYIREFSSRTGVPIIGQIPSSKIIKLCDRMNKTVIEAFPSSSEANAFRSLSRSILEIETFSVPKFIPEEEIEVLRFGVSKSSNILN